MKALCLAPNCNKRAYLIVRQVPLCHSHYEQLRLRLDLDELRLTEFVGDVRMLLQPPRYVQTVSQVSQAR